MSRVALVGFLLLIGVVFVFLDATYCTCDGFLCFEALAQAKKAGLVSSLCLRCPNKQRQQRLTVLENCSVQVLYCSDEKPHEYIRAHVDNQLLFGGSRKSDIFWDLQVSREAEPGLNNLTSISYDRWRAK
ncbi:hypothetical protein GGS21DRAFT_217024 [Xylaria nigripes]|nr:hypothetical protein GGS21DRAFT_217024 [Xylaria nigripes]